MLSRIQKLGRLSVSNISVRNMALKAKNPRYIPNSHSPEMLTAEDWRQIDEEDRINELNKLLNNTKQKMDKKDKDDLAEWLGMCEKKNNMLNIKLTNTQKQVYDNNVQIEDLQELIINPNENFTPEEHNELFDWHHTLTCDNNAATERLNKLQQTVNHHESKINRIKFRMNA